MGIVLQDLEEQKRTKYKINELVVCLLVRYYTVVHFFDNSSFIIFGSLLALSAGDTRTPCRIEISNFICRVELARR